jgi:hypothetical protein
MNDEEIILRQARQIAALEEQLEWRKEAMRKIHMEIYGIGGPLNDNLLNYSKEQMMPFFRIGRELGS